MHPPERRRPADGHGRAGARAPAPHGSAPVPNRRWRGSVVGSTAKHHHVLRVRAIGQVRNDVEEMTPVLEDVPRSVDRRVVEAGWVDPTKWSSRMNRIRASPVPPPAARVVTAAFGQSDRPIPTRRTFEGEKENRTWIRHPMQLPQPEILHRLIEVREHAVVDDEIEVVIRVRQGRHMRRERGLGERNVRRHPLDHLWVDVGSVDSVVSASGPKWRRTGRNRTQSRAVG